MSDPQTETMLSRIILAAIFIIIVCLTIWLMPALAHDAPSGWAYPPECCGERDCTQIDAKRVVELAGSYVIDGIYHISNERTRWSPDGEYHACFNSIGALICFFAPPKAY